MTILVNGIAIKSFKFSGGECHVQLLNDHLDSMIHINAKMASSDDVMSLLLTVDAVKRIHREAQIHLKIPYFPYARQDRVCNKGEALSIKVMADLINSLNCQSVTIYDPHSDVLPALLNNCIVKSLDEIVSNSHLFNLIIENKLTLVSPDAGAEKKIIKLGNIFNTRGNTTNVICATKVRNVSNGEIVAVKFLGEVTNSKLIILDDICDGGRTFIELAKKLLKAGAEEISLYVTHGIFSNGFDELKKYFQHIYCYHLLNKIKTDNEFLTVIGE